VQWQRDWDVLTVTFSIKQASSLTMTPNDASWNKSPDNFVTCKQTAFLYADGSFKLV